MWHYVLLLLTLALSSTHPSSMHDHYATLDISTDATTAAIRQRYHKLARAHHPDKTKTDSSDTFERIAEAFAILSDQTKRRQYDVQLGLDRAGLDTSDDKITEGDEPPSKVFAEAAGVRLATANGWMDGLDSMISATPRQLLVHFFKDESGPCRVTTWTSRLLYFSLYVSLCCVFWC